MDLFHDEVCSSSVTGPAWNGPTKERRQHAVDSLREALGARGTVLSDSQLLWLAADFEADVFEKSQESPECYEALLVGKLDEIGGRAARVAHAPRKHGAPAPVKPEPVEVNNGAVSASACGKGSPTPGHGITEDAWKEIQILRSLYFQPLQGSYAAIVAALQADRKQADRQKDSRSGLSDQERRSLAAFKRLVLGLVVFLAADRARIPPRFDAAKLARLEREVVQILTTMLKKVCGGVLKFDGPNLDRLTSALKAARLERKLAVTREGSGETASVKLEGDRLLDDMRPRTPPQESLLGKRTDGNHQRAGGCVHGTGPHKRSRAVEATAKEGSNASSLDWCIQGGESKLERADLPQEVHVHH